MANPSDFLVSINLNKNELLNAVVQVLASDPSSPVEGQIYYNSTDKALKQYNGTAWIEYGTGVGSGNVTKASNSAHAGALQVSGGTDKSIADTSLTAGLVKTDANGVPSNATSGTDYAPATTGTSALKGNGSGGFAGATLNDVGAPTADFSFNSHKITSLSDGVNPTDAINLGQAQALVQGLSWKQPVRVATTAAGTLASSFANGQTVDGVTLATGNRILIKDQSTGSENGIYVVAASGAPTRATDADSGVELVNATAYVSEGTANADTVWTCTNNATITPGTTALVFAQVNGGTVPAASTSVAGKSQLATQSETEARSSTTKTVTPSGLVNFPYITEHTIGDGTSTSIAVTHNRGRKGVVAQVRYASTDAVVECEIVMTDTNTTTFGFAVPPALNSLKAAILG